MTKFAHKRICGDVRHESVESARVAQEHRKPVGHYGFCTLDGVFTFVAEIVPGLP